MWHVLALPKILAYYEEILGDFSINDVTHTLHYLLKMLENMQRLDADWISASHGQAAEPGDDSDAGHEPAPGLPAPGADRA